MNPTRNRCCRLGAFVALLAVFTCSAAGAATRVALVSTKGNAEPLLALAEARLSGAQELELLDRASTDRLLQEQELAFSGLVGQALRAGQLLNVDLFAVLELETETNRAARGVAGQPLGLVVFDARTGVRCWDAALAPGEADTVAKAITQAVVQAAGRRRALNAGGRALSMLSVRNAELPREFDGWCDAVGLLLEQALLASPDVVMLERRRLGQVNAERGLPTTEIPAPLSAALIQVQLELGRSADPQGVRAVALLTDGNGRELDRVAVTNPMRDAVAVAAGLREGIGRVLRLQPGSSAADGEREARRFFRESELAFAHKEYWNALAALEAAHALAPGERAFRERLLDVLPDTAIELVDPGGQHSHRRLAALPTPARLEQAIGLGQRGADLLVEFSRDLRADLGTNTPAYELFKRSGAYWPLLRFLSKASLAAPNMSPGIRAQLQHARQTERAFRIGRLEAFWHDAVRDEASFKQYTERLTWLVLSGECAAGDPDQWVTDILFVMNRWFELRKNWPANYVPLYHLTMMGANRPGATDSFNTNFARFNPLWEAMEKDSDPILQVYGKLGRIPPTKSATGSARPETCRRVRELRLEIQQRIAELNRTTDEGVRRHLYYVAEHAGELLLNNTNQAVEYAALCEFMFAQKDFSRLTVLWTEESLERARQYAAALSVLDRAIALLDSPECPGYVENKTALRSGFVQRRTDLLRAAPELREKSGAPPWRESRQLMDVLDADGPRWLLRPVVQDRFVYAAAFRPEAGEPAFLELLRVSVDGGPAESLCRISAASLSWQDPHRSTGYWKTSAGRIGNPLRFARAACFDGQRYCLATSDGIYIFPVEGQGMRLCRTNGLPSDDVTSVACLDGKLYAGLGWADNAGYLISRAWTNGDVQLLASSRRPDDASPFDNQPPAFLPVLHADSERHRLVFPAGFERDPTLRGIWSFTPDSRQFRKLVELRLPVPPFFYWSGRVDGEHLAVPESGQALTLLDLTDDRTTRLEFRNPISSPVARRVPPGTTVLPQGRLQDGTVSISPPFFIHNGWLWVARSFQRISLDGKQQEDLPSLRPQAPFEPRECFQILPNGREALVGDQFGWWLLMFGERQ